MEPILPLGETLHARRAAYRRHGGNDKVFYDSVRVANPFGFGRLFQFADTTLAGTNLFLGSLLSSPAFFSSGENEAAAARSHMLPRCSALQRCQAGLKE